jgi:hypothetical protein
MTGISYGHFAEFSSSFPDTEADSTDVDASGDEFCLDPEARTCHQGYIEGFGTVPTSAQHNSSQRTRSGILLFS